MSIQQKLNLAVLCLGIFSVFFIAHPVAAFSDLNINGIDDSTEDEVVVTSEQSLVPGEYNFNNLTIKSGVYVNVLGDHSGETQGGVKIIAKSLIIESGAILYGMGAGYCAGPLTQFCNGGKLTIESDNLILDGGISEEGNFASSGGEIYISTQSFHGTGAVSAQGGKRYCTATCLPPGKGGHIEIKYNESTWTGQAIASAGLFCDSGGCYPMGENGYATILKTSNNDLLIVGDYIFNNFPSSLHTLTISSGSNVYFRDGTTNTINTLNVNPRAHLYLEGNSKSTIGTLNILGNFDTEDQSTLHVLENSLDSISVLNITGIAIVNPDHKLSIDTINLEDKGKITSEILNNLKLDVNKINIASTASISTEGRGECNGSMNFSLRRNHCHGTSIDIKVKELINNGMISSRGEHSTSSGSISIEVDKILGSGLIISKGGMRACDNNCFGPGSGGNISVYYGDKEFWTGTFNVEGGDPDGVPGVLIFENKCNPEAASNIMFLPGMMASRLYEDGEQVWFAASGSKQEKMVLNSNGKDDSPYVYTKDDTIHDGTSETGIFDEVLGANIYQSFIEDLRDWKEKEKIIKDYAFIPYDWRLSLADIVNNGAVANGNLFYGPTTVGGKYIIHKLEDLAANSNSCRVTIVAHSNGGLVAKYLMHQLQTENPTLASKVDKLILVASPQIGTPESFVTLLHGVRVAKGLIMDKETSRFLAENFPVIHNLLPSNAYFTTVDTNQSPLISFEDSELYKKQIDIYGADITTYNELEGYMLGTDGRVKPDSKDTKNPSIANSILYDQAEEMHTIIDNWQPPENLKVIQVAGWGEETKSNLEYVERTYFGGIKKSSIKINTTIDGDATVVEPSALWMSPENNPNIERWWVNLDRFNGIIPVLRTEHKDILEIKNLRQFLKAKINNKGFLDEEKIIVSDKPASDSVKKRLHFHLHSPLTLGVYDSEGRYNGLDPITGEVRNEIPGVYYEQVGEVQFLSIPTGIEFTLKLDGLKDGSFSLDIDEQNGNQITEYTVFDGVPSSVDTVATIDIGQNFKVGDSILKIDKENDGTIDITLKAVINSSVMYAEPVKESAVIPAVVSNGVVPIWIFNQVSNLIPKVDATPVVESNDELVIESESPLTETFDTNILIKPTEESSEVYEESKEPVEQLETNNEIKNEDISTEIHLAASVGELEGLNYKVILVVIGLLILLLGSKLIKR